MIIWWRRALIAVSAAAAVLASFVFLRDLAIYAGWPTWTAPLLPLSLDALAAAALTEYRRTRSRTAAAVSVGAVAATVTGNAASHLLSTDMLDPGWVVVTAVGSVPAITVGLVVHLFTGRTDPEWNPTSTTVTPDTAPVAGLASPPAPSSVTAETAPAIAAAAVSATKPPRNRSDDELLRLIRSRGLEDAPLRALTSELSVSQTRAKRLKDKLSIPPAPISSRSDQEAAA
ncbi:DUF2637 domain-containing protein [Jiangella muralis]|uniref:DUF2637 domain-containing protein n=1 Tax=Jiangella muralis TaxID=702383 RepID=UPI00069F1767|nr:DUF2637 domain-containing protein [Jiangella muralis]